MSKDILPSFGNRRVQKAFDGAEREARERIAYRRAVEAYEEKVIAYEKRMTKAAEVCEATGFPNPYAPLHHRRPPGRHATQVCEATGFPNPYGGSNG